MKGITPLVLGGAMAISFLAGLSVNRDASVVAQQTGSAGQAGAATQAGTRPPKSARIPLAPDMGEPLHWSVDDFHKAHNTMVKNPKAAISDLLSLPITRTHMFSFRHSGPASGDAPPAGEMHEGVSELHIIVAGNATAFLGGELTNRRGGPPERPGEWNGQVTGARTFKVKAGDVVNIPPGAPHAYRPEGAEGVTYMLVKINVGLYPWALVAGANLPQ